MAVVVTNNATSTLAAGVAAGATTLTVQSADAAKFPVISGSDWFPVTLVSGASNLEICRCTARSGATLTVLRGQEGTTARAWSSGDKISHRLTAAAIADLAAGGGGAAIYIGDGPPASPSIGKLWWESDTGNLFIWYDDGVGAPQWVPATVGSLPTAGASGGIPEAPTDGQNYERRGSDGSWQVAASGGITEAPNDANAYVRSALAWVIGYTKAAIDTLLGAKVAKAGDAMTGALTINSTTSAPLALTSTQAGGDGVVLTTFHDSASPEAFTDYPFRLITDGRDSSGNRLTYGELQLWLTNPTDTAESSQWKLGMIDSYVSPSAMAYPFTFHNNGLSVFSTRTDANGGPTLLLQRDSPSPANADQIGTINFSGRNSSGFVRSYGMIYARIDDVANGSEDASFVFSLYANAAAGDVLVFNKATGATFSTKVITPASAAGGAGFFLGNGVTPTTPIDGDFWMASQVYYRAGGSTITLLNNVHTQTINGVKTFGTKPVMATPSTTQASINLPHNGVVVPTTPVDGDLWTTTAGLFARINGATVGPLGAGGGAGVTDGDKGDIVVSGSGATWMLDSTVVTAAAKTVLDDATIAAMVTTLDVVDIGSAQSITGAKDFFAAATFWQKASFKIPSAATTASITLPHGTAPTTPVNGDMWTTTTGLYARINGATVGPLAGATDISGKENTITGGTTLQYWRGDKSWQTLDKAAVGLANVDNTSDANKPVSTAQAAADALKLNSSAYTAADVLAKLVTVDGAGSGLDADLLDGNSSVFFLPAANLTGGKITISSTAPSSPSVNDVWIQVA